MRSLISIFQEAERGMKRIMSVPSYTVLLLLCLGGLSAQAATIYVKPQGNDATPCAQAQNAQTPRRTIHAGIACLSGGDTLIVGGGTYTECISDYGAPRPPSGTSWSNPTTIKSDPPRAAVLKPPQPECSGGAAVIELGVPGSRYIIVDGFIIDGLFSASTNSQGVGLTAWDTDHIRFQNMEIKHFRTAVSTSGEYIEMLNLHVHHIGIPECTSPSGCSGFYIRKQNNVIDRALVHDTTAYGVQFTSGGGFSVTDNTIKNSTLFNNR